MDTPLPLPDDARARLAALLPPLVRDLRSVPALAWQAELVARAQAAVEELMELVSPLPMRELQSAVRDVYAYLAGAHLARVPDEAYSSAFAGRTERLAELLAEFLPAESGQRYLDVFNEHGRVPAAIAHAFGQSGFRVRGFADAAALATAIAEQPPVALLVEAPLVAKACETLDALARQVPAS